MQAGAAGAFGTGGVTVDNTDSPNSIARINIAAGVTNAISDAAILSLLGGERLAWPIKTLPSSGPG